MNRKERREQARRGGSGGPADPGAIPPGTEGFRMRMGSGTPADRDKFIDGAHFIPGAMVMQPDGSGPGGTPPPAIPLMVVSTATLRETPGLQRLFDLQRQHGTQWLGKRIEGQVGWSMMGGVGGGPDDTPMVILRLRLTGPHLVHTDFLLDVAQLAQVLRVAVDSPLLGLITEAELASWQVNPPADFAEGMQRVPLIPKQPSTVLRQALMLYDNGRS